jgi:hypothetical protein
MYSMQHYVIKLVSDLWQVGGFHRVHQSCWHIIESGAKHHIDIITRSCLKYIMFFTRSCLKYNVHHVRYRSCLKYIMSVVKSCLKYIMFFTRSVLYTSCPLQVVVLDMYSIQHYVIKLVSDLWQVGGFHRVHQSCWHIIESGAKHHNPSPNTYIMSVASSCLKYIMYVTRSCLKYIRSVTSYCSSIYIYCKDEWYRYECNFHQKNGHDEHCI